MGGEPGYRTAVKTVGATSPGIIILTYLTLTFAFSAIYWYQIAIIPKVAGNAILILGYSVAAMWSPGMAALITSLFYQGNLKGFGFNAGKPVWLAAGILIPILIGLLMFGSAWVSGIAPFNAAAASSVLTFGYLPIVAGMILFNCFAACGEEIGWRGLLVPELARTMSFTRLALLSGAIWTVWHFPMIVFGTYHSTGPVWYSLAVFIPSVMGAGLVLAWLRLMSGSVWVAVLFHGFWNYFIQQFYPTLTVTTPDGTMMLGEFGWFVAATYVVLAFVFWHFRDRLPKVPAGE